MISIIIMLPLRKVLDTIESRITVYKKNPTIYTINFFLKEEFIGNVEHDFFWIQKARPRYYNGPKRAFFGKIERVDDNTTKITGKFKILYQYKIIMILFQVITFVNILIGIYYRSFFYISCTAVIDVLYTFMFNKASKVFYKKEEADVIAFLSELGV